MEKVTAYKCSFCKDSTRRLYLSPSGCRRHEKRCWLNPARKSCATCLNLYSHYDDDKDKSGWRCLDIPSIVPFKSKISNCHLWQDRGTIFDNEEVRFDRPIER